MKSKNFLQVSIIALTAATMSAPDAMASARNVLTNQGFTTDPDTMKKLVSNKADVQEYSQYFKSAGVSPETFFKDKAAKVPRETTIKEHAGEMELNKLVAKPTQQQQEGAASLVQLGLPKFTLAQLNAYEILVSPNPQGLGVAAPSIDDVLASALLLTPQLGGTGALQTFNEDQLKAVDASKIGKVEQVTAWAIQNGFGAKPAGTIPNAVAQLSSVTGGIYDFKSIVHLSNVAAPVVPANPVIPVLPVNPVNPAVPANPAVPVIPVNPVLNQLNFTADPARVTNGQFKVSGADLGALAHTPVGHYVVFSDLLNSATAGQVVPVDPAVAPKLPTQ